MYEDFILTLPERLQPSVPREVPYLNRPTFLYFEKDWTPRLQLVSYRSPPVWTFAGDAVEISRSRGARLDRSGRLLFSNPMFTYHRQGRGRTASGAD